MRRGVLALLLPLLTSCGDGPSPEALHEEAVAALAAGDGKRAEALAGEAARIGGEAFAARRDFIRGNAAFARSLAAEAEAARPGGDPIALETALVLAEDALGAWQRAATSRADWPSARRNLERAVLRVEALRKAQRRRTAGDGAPPDAPPDRPPDLPPPRPAPVPGEEPAPQAATRVETAELPSDRVLGLLEALRRMEREKQDLRRARRAALGSTADRDW